MGFLRRAPWISEGPEIAVQSRIGNYTSYARLRLDPAHVDPKPSFRISSRNSVNGVPLLKHHPIFLPQYVDFGTVAEAQYRIRHKNYVDVIFFLLTSRRM